MRSTRRWPSLLLVVASCATLPHPRPDLYGTVRVAFGASLDGAEPWRDDQRAELRAELVALGALGPAVVEASEGDADLVLRTFDSTAADPAHRRCGAGVARYWRGAGYAEIDPTCAAGYDELRAAAGHEFGHFEGMAHICEHYEADASCDPRYRGDAMMNPSIAYQVDGSAEEPDGASAGIDVAQPRPTALDVAAFRALHPPTAW